MATRYVKHTGSNTAPYDTWAKAATKLKTAMEAATAGDTIYVSHQHSESQSTSMSINGTGTVAAPLLVLCVNDGAEPPTALATSATVSTTLGTTIALQGSHYVYGIQFSAGSGTDTGAAISMAIVDSTAAVVQHYDNCALRVANTSAGSSLLAFGSTGAANHSRLVRLSNCTYKSGNAGQSIVVRKVRVEVEGGAVEAGSSTPTANGLCSVDFNGNVLFSGVDLSNFDAALPLLSATSSGSFRYCKLPASWSGSLFVSTPTGRQSRGEMHNCDSSDTNYKIWIEDYSGSVKDETTIVLSGGASDGTTALSWRMASSANANYPVGVLLSPEIHAWNDTTGTAKTVTVEVLTDGVTLKDDECWLEVMYLGTSGYPLGTWINDAKADVLSTAANQTSSTATWTTTGLTTPVKQKLSVTFTPQEKGPIVARVCLAKPSTTVYVDPLLTVS